MVRIIYWVRSWPTQYIPTTRRTH